MYVKDSCGLRKMPRFRDAATGWHRRYKQRNSILIWVVLPALKLILLAARPPVSSIAFLRLFLRHHFVGSWLSRYTMETALFSILLPTTEHFLRADWVDTPWRQLCLASYYLQQNIPDVSWQRRAQIKQKAWPMEKNGKAANWAPEVVFSPFHALSRRQITFPSCC